MTSGKRAGKPRTSIWLTGKPVPKRRSDAPGGGEGAALDLDRILSASVRLLDADGLAKFSMRRLAAELGVTAMSVYWYVDTKDDLLELVLDEVNGEMTLPDPADESADWREQLRQLALGYRGLLLAHPWVSRLVGQYFNVGPRAMAFAEATLAVMRRSGGEQETVLGGLSALFEFVYGFATIDAVYRDRCREAGLSPDEYFRHVESALTSREEFSEQYRQMSEVLDSRHTESVEVLREREFELGLETVLAGIEVMVGRDRAKTG
ncbi:TetR/AcrR family transcriptional regulator [Streptomyces gamaensis]|uniref:TetR/AcrR family transcriptional regulator n=1 Tax=Streptomyces gamaensis TaxID=1763542 RepID=A0ABW0YXF9_9ACTN